MKASKALRAVVRSSDLTALEISRRIGRKDNYVPSLLSRGSCPTAETLATIAGICGWKLCLVGPDREIEIDGWKLKARKTIPVGGGKRAAKSVVTDEIAVAVPEELAPGEPASEELFAAAESPIAAEGASQSGDAAHGDEEPLAD